MTRGKEDVGQTVILHDSGGWVFVCEHSDIALKTMLFYDPASVAAAADAAIYAATAAVTDPAEYTGSDVSRCGSYHCNGHVQ